MNFPREIWDKILIDTNDLSLAILYKNEYVIRNLFDKDKHTFYWCIMHNNLIVFNFLAKKTYI